MLADNIHIVLVNPSHPGNIGAAARAMKTMGLNKMVLVAPRDFPSESAAARSAGAEDILDNAQVYETLETAIASFHWIVGASARSRRISWPVMGPRSFAEKVSEQSELGPIGLLFGRERSGLSNEELDLCHAMVAIPSSQGYASLNLAAAVQVLAYEIFRQSGAISNVAKVPSKDLLADRPANQKEMSDFYCHLETVLEEIEFLDADNPRKLMRRLHRLFNRAKPELREYNILRGILTAVQEKFKRH